MKTYQKITAIFGLSSVLALSGCATGGGMESQRGNNSMLGAAIGAAVGAIATDGVDNETTRGAVILGAGAAGYAIGSKFEPACVNETNTRMTRSINGNATTAWQGSQEYNENCLGKGAQDVPRANLPAATQTRGWANN